MKEINGITGKKTRKINEINDTKKDLYSPLASHSTKLFQMVVIFFILRHHPQIVNEKSVE